MKILLSGSHGLVGRALRAQLESQKQEVVALVRKNAQETEVSWDPAQGKIDGQKLENIDAVIHLAGESIASGRWTPEKKRIIRDSRVLGTQLLSETLAKLQRPPKIFLSASAIGFYGDRGDEILNETAAPGGLFLSRVCADWEAAAEAVKRKGIRTAHLRFGVILSKDGGALAKMLPPFRSGLGGVLGSGRQYMSWISLEDVVGAILHVLKLETIKGPVNVVSPNPVRNVEFTKTLGRVLSRPTVLPMPAFAARALFGQMADELLLSSARVQPSALESSGYSFLHPQLPQALQNILRRD